MIYRFILHIKACSNTMYDYDVWDNGSNKLAIDPYAPMQYVCYFVILNAEVPKRILFSLSTYVHVSDLEID